MMAQINFISNLMELNPDDISDKQVRAVKDLLKKLDLPTDKMETISIAGFGLMTWVVAIMKYCNVAKQVVPKRKAVEMALKSQLQNEKDLETIKEEIETLGSELRRLEQQYATGAAEQHELKEQAELMEKRLVAASTLIAGLGTERVRWTREMERLARKRKRLVGDCAMAAAFLSYGGPFSPAFRQSLQSAGLADLRSRAVPFSEPFRVTDFLTDDVELSRWVAEGLPSDELSAANGLLTTRASRWPLCVDPQGQARQWILRREAKQRLVTRSPFDSDLAKQLELAVSFGLPLLIEGVDETLDPLLDPVLEKNVKVSGSRKFIYLGDKEVDWNDNFRLYMTTKVSNPNFTAEIYGKTMVIDYNVTEEGLEDQLLNVVVGYEQPELEQRREALVVEMSENRTLLKNFEDTLLRELASSSGQMLDNSELIATLEGTKEKAVEIAEKLEIAKTTAKEIERHREGYRAASERGAILFSVLSSLSSINSMYQYALTSFLEVFKKSLSLAPFDTILAKRLDNIIETLTVQVYNYTCMGLFERHKLLFSFQMCVSLMQADKTLSGELFDFFLHGNRSLEKEDNGNSLLWLPEDTWHHLSRLVALSPFEYLKEELEQNSAAWESWYDSEFPEETSPPMEGLTELAKLVLLRFFRPDRLYMGIRKFVVEHLGPKFVEPAVVTYQRIYDLSTPFSPVVFVLSPGADPANDVRKLAEKMGFSGIRLKEHPLGQNQGPVAAALLESGAARGQWIMLQNCHLLTSWLKTLEKLLEKLQVKPHKDFRVWLTTEPTDEFPVGILQRSLKIVTEPPGGLKLNMSSNFSKITQDTLDLCPHQAFKPLVYVLAFFHAVVQERRKYGNIGWNIPYDFNESDFSASLMILNTYLAKSKKSLESGIPWGSLRYLIGEVTYGGRVTDAFDRRVLKTYLEEYMGDFLFDTFQLFRFYKDDKIEYVIPNDGPLQNYVSMIESLPHVNSPEVFGLHSNAEIAHYTDASSELLENMVHLQVTQRISDGVNSHNYTYLASLARDILGKVPPPFEVGVISKEMDENRSPTEIVLLQELERWNILVNLMKSTLVQLQHAILGEIGMSNQLEDLMTYLLLGAIPSSWRKAAPATTFNLADWMDHFKKRHEQYSEWVREEPKVMWLSGLHVPESYLKALVQKYCRKKGWVLDRTTIFTQVTSYKSAEEIDAEDKIDGCYISGLALEGASWDFEQGCLTKQEAKKLITDFPLLKVIPMESTKIRLHNTFRTPVYMTRERTNKMGVGLVFEADLPTDIHPSHWVLQGVCLLLNK